MLVNAYLPTYAYLPMPSSPSSLSVWSALSSNLKSWVVRDVDRDVDARECIPTYLCLPTYAFLTVITV